MKKTYRVLIMIAIVVLSALAMRSATPVSAPDGVEIAPSAPILWKNGSTNLGAIYTTLDGYFYLHGGNSAAQLSINPGDIDTQYMLLSGWSNSVGGIKVYNDHVVVDGIFWSEESVSAPSMQTDQMQVDEDLSVVGNSTVGGNATVTGTVSASNLSGTNTGDQTIDLLIGGNGMNTQTAASSTTYLAPFYTGAPQALEYDVLWNAPKVCTLSSLYVRTRTTQPSTGSLVFTVRLDNTNTAITATVAANTAATLVSDTSHTAAIAYAGQRVSLSVVNNATSSSAKIASWSLSCASQ